MRVDRGSLDAARLPLGDPSEVVVDDGELAREALCLLTPARPLTMAEEVGEWVASSPGGTGQNERVMRLVRALADEERDAMLLGAVDDAARRAIAPRLARVRDMAAVVDALLSMRAEARAEERALRTAR